LPWILNNVPQCHHHQWKTFLYFSHFLLIFWLYAGRLPYLEVYPRPWKYYPTSSLTMSTIPQFYLIFLTFYDYFWIDYHIWMSILNPEHISKCDHHKWEHPVIFYDCATIFWLFLDRFLYLEMHLGPWKQSPRSSSTVSITPKIFCYFIAIFIFQIALLPATNKLQKIIKVGHILQSSLINNKRLQMSDIDYYKVGYRLQRLLIEYRRLDLRMFHCKCLFVFVYCHCYFIVEAYIQYSCCMSFEAKLNELHKNLLLQQDQ
jgi:hypothetical protein